MAAAAEAVSSQSLVLDRYRPLRPLGSGGSGSVWLARDELSGLDVALKIVDRDGKAGFRAEREAAAAARLRHERCQRAYALATDDRHVYIAYEYVAGRTLREALRAGELSDAGAVEAAAQVLEGLAHAHSRGVVHRDVKPANVLLAEGPGISVRLLDFGLAQFAEAETLTAAGDVPGTLAYISPERLQGGPGSAAGDVWSVGVLLWEALAGRHPFWAPSLLQTARKIKQGAPPLRSVRPDVPRALAAAVDRSLAPNPARRPSAAALGEMLRRTAPGQAARPERPKMKVAALPKLTARPLSPVRLVPAVLAAIVAAWAAEALSFYPAGWPAGLAVACGLATLVKPRLGLAATLFVPLLPLGNISLGVALAYGAVAAAWFAVFARTPGAGLAFALGPLLAPLGLVALLPLALVRVRSAVRRGLAAVAAVVVSAIVAGIRGTGLPFTGERSPASLGLDGTEALLTVAVALWTALTSRPELLLEALAFGAAAALLPYAAARGVWALAVFGGAMTAATILPLGAVSAVPLVAAIWLTCVVLAVPDEAAKVYHAPRKMLEHFSG